MKLNKTYVIKDDSLNKVIDKLSDALDDVYAFTKTYPDYNFKVNVSEENETGWYAEINIKYEESKDKKAVVPPIEPPTLL